MYRISAKIYGQDAALFVNPKGTDVVLELTDERPRGYREMTFDTVADAGRYETIVREEFAGVKVDFSIQPIAN